MNLLKEEALWFIKNFSGQLKTEDTAIICQSWNQLDEYLEHLKEAFSFYSAIHAIAIKTNPHPEVLRYIVSKGFGLEAASMEEVEMAIEAGISTEKLVFDSPVKTRAEIKKCNEKYAGIKLNVNSLEELNRIPANPNFSLGLRINPMVDTGSPDLYHVSSDESKFGEPISNDQAIISACQQFPITQLHIHSGSALGNLDVATAAIAAVVELANRINVQLELASKDYRIKSIDIGGGLKPEKLGTDLSQMKQYANLLVKNVPDLVNFELVTEFGQWCHFYCGFAFSTVEYVMFRGKKQLAFVHLGADYFMRDAYVKPRGIEFICLDKEGKVNDGEKQTTDIAGPLCFAGDYLVKDIPLSSLSEGDTLLMLGTGSNTYGLWSRHCSRTIPKVVGVDFEKLTYTLLSERIKLY